MRYIPKGFGCCLSRSYKFRRGRFPNARVKAALGEIILTFSFRASAA